MKKIDPKPSLCQLRKNLGCEDLISLVILYMIMVTKMISMQFLGRNFLADSEKTIANPNFF